MIPAVVYPAETSVSFGVIESLSLAKIPIIGLNHRKTYHSLSNRFKFMLCPNPIKEQDAFIDFLVSLGERLGKAALFVTSDISVFLVLQNSVLLKKYYCYPYFAPDKIKFSFDKWSMFQVAERLDIPTPVTIKVDYADPLFHDKARALHFPVVIKPVARFLIKGNRAEKIDEFYGRYNNVKALIAYDYAELLYLAREVTSSGFEVIAQEQIPGLAPCLYETKFYVDRQGLTADMVVTRKIRQFPADLGMCSLGELAICPIVEDYSFKFLKEIGYRGIGEIEFKYDERDNKFKLLELNPRPIHWMSLLTFSGHNIALKQYEDYTGSPHKGREKICRNRTRWFHLEGEVYYWAIYGLNKSSPYYISWIEQLRSIFAKPSVEAFCSWRDPIFTAVYILKYASLVIWKLVQLIIVRVSGIYISKKDGTRFVKGKPVEFISKVE